jgi:hypothetical protein
MTTTGLWNIFYDINIAHLIWHSCFFVGKLGDKARKNPEMKEKEGIVE